MKLRVPLEILRQILRDMVDLLPLDEVLRARRVNSFFDQEIMNMLIDYDTFGCFKCGSSRSHSHEWVKLPRFFKGRCLRRKLEMHAQTPCILSMWIEEMLDGEEKSGNITTKTQRDAVRERLLHGATTGRFDPHHFLCPGVGVTDCLEWYTDQRRYEHRITWEPLDKTFKVLMMCGAIRRGDAAELDELLRKGWDPADYTSRFDRVPLDVAAKKGNGDIIRVLLKRAGRWNLSYHYNYNLTDVWKVAARSGNKEVLDALIDDAKARNNGQIGAGLVDEIRAVARIGKLDMVQYFLERCTRDGELLRQWALTEAIRSSQMAVIEWLVQQGGGVNDSELCGDDDYYKGPLYEALTCSDREKTPDIVKLLLERGVDPNKAYPTLTKTVFQTALLKDDMESAMILLEYGADLTTRSLPAGSGGKKLAQPLFWVHKRGKTALFHAMLDKGVDNTVRHKGKKYTVSRERECIDRVERVFEDLGWDETEIKDAEIDYLIIQTG